MATISLFERFNHRANEMPTWRPRFANLAPYIEITPLPHTTDALAIVLEFGLIFNFGQALEVAPAL